MKVKNSLAALPLVLNACGGEDSSNVTPNELGQGIWEGAFSVGPISTSTSASGAVTAFDPTESTGVGLYTTDDRVFFYNIDDDILFTNDIPGIVNNNLIYGPDTYLAGNLLDSNVSFDGNLYISTSIEGQYNSFSATGNYVMLFDNKYFRGADLNRLVGDWSYSGANEDWNLAINSDGSFTGDSTKVAGCTLEGSFSTIDPSKNEYSIDVTLSTCGSFDGVYTGLAATVDTSSTNDTLLMAIYTLNSGHAFFMKPVKQP